MPIPQHHAASNERMNAVEPLSEATDDPPLSGQSNNDCSDAEQEMAKVVAYWSTAFACSI